MDSFSLKEKISNPEELLSYLSGNENMTDGKRRKRRGGYRRILEEEINAQIKTLLANEPDKFEMYLPVMRLLSEKDTGKESIAQIADQFIASYPKESTELLISCIKDEEFLEDEYLDKILEYVENLTDSGIPLDQKAQTNLLDLVNYDNPICFKIMGSPAFSKKTKQDLLNQIPDERHELWNRLLAEKLCSPDEVVFILNKLKDSESYNKIIKNIKRNYAGDAQIQNAFQAICTQKRNQKIIIRILEEQPADQKVEKFIRLADEMIKSKDEQKIANFKDLLFCLGEEYVFEIDKQAMSWFVNNGSEKDLEALNNLRQIYGLKTELSEYWHCDPDVNDAKRIRFEGSYSAIGKLQNNSDDENPHYTRKLSKAYLEFKPDYSRDFEPKEYNLHKNKAYNTFASEGVNLPIRKLQQAFATLHMPPETAEQLNGTDLQHLLVTYYSWNLERQDDYLYEDHDTNLTESLTNSIHDENEGQKVSMKEFSSKAPVSIRSKKWKNFARNQELVDFVSADLKRYEIDDDTIRTFWENARDHGNPCFGTNGRASFWGLRSSLHHGEPLRQGGTNEQSTIITLNIREEGYVTRYDDEGYEYSHYQEGGNIEVHSHEPFHFFDNPCVYLYQNPSDGKLTVSDKKSKAAGKRMMITTRPSAGCREGEQVVYYGGPRECSCAIMDKSGHIRQASYDFWKETSQTAEKTLTSPKAAKIER